MLIAMLPIRVLENHAFLKTESTKGLQLVMFETGAWEQLASSSFHKPNSVFKEAYRH